MKKVRNGDNFGISAQTFNTFVDAARDFQKRQRQSTTPPAKTAEPRDIVLAKNMDSELDALRFYCVGITNTIIDPTNESGFLKTIGFEVEQYDADTHGNRFAICVEPLQYDKIRKARVSGVFGCKVYISDETHRFAVPSNGYLQSASGGPVEIIWSESGTGTLWAYVRMNGSSGFGTLDPFTVPSGTDATADTTEWDITDQPLKEDGVTPYLGVIIEAQTRIYSDGTSTYQFQREVKADSAGNVVYVGPEVREELQISGGNLTLYKVLSVDGNSASAAPLNVDGSLGGEAQDFIVI